MTSRPRQIVFWLLAARHSGTRPAPGFSARHLRSKPSVREPPAFPSAHSTLSPGGFLGDACAPNRGDRLRSDASGTLVCLRRQSIHPVPSGEPHQHQQHDGDHECEHVLGTFGHVSSPFSHHGKPTNTSRFCTSRRHPQPACWHPQRRPPIHRIKRRSGKTPPSHTPCGHTSRRDALRCTRSMHDS